MEAKQKRDIDKEYPKAAFVAKLRRLADAIERPGFGRNLGALFFQEKS